MEASRPKHSRFRISASFWRLFASQVLSSFGEYVLEAAIVVWAVLRTGGDPSLSSFAVSAMLIATFAPRIIFAPLAGHLADRFPWTRIMQVSLAARVLCLAVLAITLPQMATSTTDVLLAAALIFGISAAGQFYVPARAAAAQHAIPVQARPEAASISQFGVTGVGILATMLGPMAFTWLGMSWTILFCAIALVLATIPLFASGLDAPTNRGWETGVLREYAGNVAYVWRDPVLRAVLISSCIYGSALGITNQTLPLFAFQSLSLTPVEYGFVTASFAVGGLVGSLLSSFFVRRAGDVQAMVIALGSLGIGYAAYALVGNSLSAAIVMGVLGVLFAAYMSSQGPVLQRVVGERRMGAVVTIMSPGLGLLTIIFTGITGLAYSWLLPYVDARALYMAGLFAAAAILLMVSAVIGVSLRRIADPGQQ